MSHTKGPWTSNAQKGRSGHCLVAQVWGPDGKSLATLESTTAPSVATANARLIAAAPELLEALKASNGFLLAAGYDHAAARNDELIRKAEGK